MTKNNEHNYESYGEVKYCHDCKGLEESVPTDCPQQEMTEKQKKQVISGVLDFTKEDGWIAVQP